jgi:hypothetical protein
MALKKVIYLRIMLKRAAAAAFNCGNVCVCACLFVFNQKNFPNLTQLNSNVLRHIFLTLTKLRCRFASCGHNQHILEPHEEPFFSAESLGNKQKLLSI